MEIVSLVLGLMLMACMWAAFVAVVKILKQVCGIEDDEQ